MEGDMVAARMSMVPATHVLKHIPRRIGDSKALDDAARCVVKGSLCGRLQQQIEAQKLYVTAVTSLRTALDEYAGVCTPQTLAAASLLQMYEQHVRDDTHDWVYHARGVVQMLQARKLQHPKDEMERAILEAEVASSFMSAAVADKTGFLSNPAWHRVMKPLTPHRGPLCEFMQMVGRGTRLPSFDSICARFIQECTYGAEIHRSRRERITATAFAEVFRIRSVLSSHIQGRSDCPGLTSVTDPMADVAFAATGLFLVIIDALLIREDDRLRRLTPCRPPVFPDGISSQVLRDERASTFDVAAARLKALSAKDSSVHAIASNALHVIIGVIIGFRQPDVDETQILLEILTQGFGAPQYFDTITMTCDSAVQRQLL